VSACGITKHDLRLVALEISESTIGLVQCKPLQRRCCTAADAVWSGPVWGPLIGGGEDWTVCTYVRICGGCLGGPVGCWSWMEPSVL
jgi:hypothetical protein